MVAGFIGLGVVGQAGHDESGLVVIDGDAVDLFGGGHRVGVIAAVVGGDGEFQSKAAAEILVHAVVHGGDGYGLGRVVVCGREG